METPPYWVNRSLSGNFDGRYDGTSERFRLIEVMLERTFRRKKTRDRSDTMPTSLQLLKIQRIEDRDQWVRYQNAKEALVDKRSSEERYLPRVADISPGGDVKTKCCTIDNRLLDAFNEYFLWHGTTPESVDGIAEHGFKLNLAGSHAGTMFGKGIYLAECSSKSDEYAHEGKGIYQGIYALVLCRAVCGSIFYTERSDIPAVERAINSGQYDSVLGDREKAVNTYREFVVFDEHLVYPEFVCLYQRSFD